MLRVPFMNSRVTPDGRSERVLSTQSRFLAALLGCGLAAALLVASQLRPDPRGRGTHEQLGLPPCTLWAISGLRCPACGMTTSWALATHGQLAAAMQAHAVGTLLAGVAVVTAVVSLAIAAVGRPLRWPITDNLAAAVGVTFVAMLIVEWIVRIKRG